MWQGVEVAAWLDELGGQGHLGNPGQCAGYGTGRLGLVGVTLKLGLADVQRVSFGVQVYANQSGRTVDVAQLHTRVGAQRFGGVSGGAEDARQGHREAGSVRGGDQLLRIRPLPLPEPRLVRVVALEDAVPDGHGSRTPLQVPVPFRAPVSCCPGYPFLSLPDRSGCWAASGSRKPFEARPGRAR